jgi:hypothetical protein
MTSTTLPRHRLRSRQSEPEAPPPAERPDPTSDAERAAALEIEVEQLRAAMASRACIEQAKGILMLLTGCSDEGAFALLSHISGRTHRKLRDVAAAITGSACGSTPLPPDIRAIVVDACPPGGPRA